MALSDSNRQQHEPVGHRSSPPHLESSNDRDGKRHEHRALAEAILFETAAGATTEAGETYLDTHRLRPAPDHESVAITVDEQLLVVESAIETGDVPKIGAM